LICATLTPIQISTSAPYLGSSEAAMANPAVESKDEIVKLDFNRRLMLQFRASVVTSDAGLLAYRELDDALGLTAMAGETLADGRTGKNGRHAWVGLLRKSEFGRLAGYEDVNDAQRLRHDPAMRRRESGSGSRSFAQPRWAVSRRSGLRHVRTSLLFPTYPVGGSSLCMAATPQEASCLTWIRA
jgi:hypothetical protein